MIGDNFRGGTLNGTRRGTRQAAALTLVLTLLAEGTMPAAANAGHPAPEGKELTVFAAASLTETLQDLEGGFLKDHPEAAISYNFDSSGTLKTQIQEGAECDVFLSAAPKQMNELEEAGELEAGSRIDLLENRVALAVPDGNPKGIISFDDLADRLQKAGDGKEEILLDMGNADVPVGQYTQKILAYYGLQEEDLAQAGCITYGTNVKDVTSQVSEAAVDCGVIYQTDAYSADLTVVDTATPDMCGQVIYPAAVLKRSGQKGLAEAYLAYLQTPPAQEIFEKVGFTPIRSAQEAATEPETASQ